MRKINSVLLVIVLALAFSLCGCNNKTQPNGSQSSANRTEENTDSLTVDDVLGNDSHTDFNTWDEYEFDDAGTVIGQSVFRATKDGVVYLLIHYAMDDVTEIYEYDETKNPAVTVVTWKNGNSTKEFTAGELVRCYEIK